MFERIPLISPPRRNHQVVRAAQGAILAVFAPAGWLLFRASQGDSMAGLLESDPGLYAYMLFGTMAAFSLFGWLLGREEGRLSRLAMLDELTGLYNNRLFGQRLEEALAYSRRARKPLSLMLIDMDHFKGINDSLGHQAGDMALKTAAAVIRASVRMSDIPARVGGEEFAVILPATAEEDAALVAERVLSGLRSARVLVAGKATVRLSASIGLAGGVPGEGDSSFALFAEADRALYKAKGEGRDRLARA